MTKSWQNYSYSFPTIGYSALYLVDIEGRSSPDILIPDHEMYRNKDDILTSIANTNKDLAKESADKEILPNPMAIRLELDQLFPLTKHMWNDNGLEYDMVQRVADFAKYLKCPVWYWMLVVPVRIVKGVENFQVAMPIPTTTTEEDLQKLMHMLKYPVDEKATHGGLYTYKSFMQFDEDKGSWIEKRKDWGVE